MDVCPRPRLFWYIGDRALARDRVRFEECAGGGEAALGSADESTRAMGVGQRSHSFRSDGLGECEPRGENGRLGRGDPGLGRGEVVILAGEFEDVHTDARTRNGMSVTVERTPDSRDALDYCPAPRRLETVPAGAVGSPFRSRWPPVIAGWRSDARTTNGPNILSRLPVSEHYQPL